VPGARDPLLIVIGGTPPFQDERYPPIAYLTA